MIYLIFVIILGCLHTVVMVAIGMEASVTSDCHGNRCKQQSRNHQEFKIPDHFTVKILNVCLAESLYCLEITTMRSLFTVVVTQCPTLRDNETSHVEVNKV